MYVTPYFKKTLKDYKLEPKIEQSIFLNLKKKRYPLSLTSTYFESNLMGGMNTKVLNNLDLRFHTAI